MNAKDIFSLNNKVGLLLASLILLLIILILSGVSGEVLTKVGFRRASDLTVKISWTQATPITPPPGSTGEALPDVPIVFDGTIINSGTKPTGKSQAALVVFGPRGFKELFDTPKLKPGKSYGVQATLLRPVSGTYTVYFCADVLGQIKESNEQNNCTRTILVVKEGLPDLTTTDIQWAVRQNPAGFEIIATATVANIGAGSSSETVGFDWVVSSQDQVFDQGTVAIPPLAAGAKANVSWTISPTLSLSPAVSPSQHLLAQISPAPTVSYTIGFCADYRSLTQPGPIAESNEKNNCLTKPFNIAQSQPDLVVLDIKIGGDVLSPTPTVLSAVEIKTAFVVSNIGQDVAGENQAVVLIVGLGGTVPEQIFINEYFTPTLKPGASYSTTTEGIRLSVGKRYRLAACADAANQVVESTEDNNCKEKIFTINDFGQIIEGF